MHLRLPDVAKFLSKIFFKKKKKNHTAVKCLYSVITIKAIPLGCLT